ncbi:Ig-like domain-containing protein [bacterium]
MHKQIIRIIRYGLILFSFIVPISLLTQPQLKINRDVLNFGAIPGVQTGSQSFFIDDAGDGTLNWTVSSEHNWLAVVPQSGSGSCMVTVSVDPGEMNPGFYFSNIIVTNEDNPGDQVHISGVLEVYGTTKPPFGAFDTPMDGSTVSGSIAITGWALDDIGVKSVTIYKDVDGDQHYLGQASLVEGARPDVEADNPGTPLNYKAYWEWAMQTALEEPGMWTIYAVARDEEGYSTELGSRTITVDNENAVKPFGAIDTPASGGTASGTSYRVSGWVLTPQPNQIPEDGSAINVYVDNAPVGQATCNVYRQDIAALFPDYANSNGAGAFFDLNTTDFANGVHSIHWTATDNAGNTDGIGSRYFTIQNQDMPRPVVNRTRVNFGADLEGNHTSTQSVRISNGGGGNLNWEVNFEDWLWWSIDPLSGENTGYIEVSVDPEGLEPLFYSGTTPIYIPDTGMWTELTLGLWKTDMSSSHYIPFGEFDTPKDGSTVSGSIAVTGWALDELGVELVKIYAQPEGGSSVYIGDGVFVEGARPDIAQTKTSAPMNYKAGWGYMLLTNTLPGGGQGNYTLEAVATNIAGKEVSLGTKTIFVDNENSVQPFGAIDSPGWGGVVSGSSAKITGWALTREPNIIPADGSTTYLMIDGLTFDTETSDDWGDFEIDIDFEFGGSEYSEPVGWEAVFNSLELSNGTHSLTYVLGHESGGSLPKVMNSETVIISQLFVVDNESAYSSFSENKPGPTIPDQFALYPVFPNPFNPIARISYRLNCPGRVNLYIFDLLGHRVRNLLSDQLTEAGKYETEWYGTDNAGKPLASGVYVLYLKIGKEIQTRKMLLIR